MNHPETETVPVVERVARRIAATALPGVRWATLTDGTRGSYRTAAREVIALVQTAASVPPPATRADAGRRARYAAAIAEGFRAFDADTTSDAHLDADLLDAVVSVADAEVAAVRALHQPMQRGPFTICAHCSGWDGKWRCLGVVTDFPCPTIRALDGEEPEPSPSGVVVEAGDNQAETLPKRPPMDAWRLLGIDACPTPLTHNVGCGCPTGQTPAARARPAEEAS